MSLRVRVLELEEAVNRLVAVLHHRSIVGTLIGDPYEFGDPNEPLGPCEEPPVPATSPAEDPFMEAIHEAVLSCDDARIRQQLGVGPEAADAIARAGRKLYNRGSAAASREAMEMLRQARSPGDL